ncbi:DeoR/GlpR family DNA-binding transcription regulator [Ammoniphilus resinae]|uniref:DeoR/GlpR family transcriptional regulator of sugar metabolism n=1 Tax=Ammoniphilus resinae TaxID=861532 RepID=A0ABS4GWC8_9BACL|nr:DeoR/GlpR family DNA-binding transcription regulator [Ammoniphilus resinae]MBP1934566.1 DeoR/GlpR family transcriptional regulator of sugar metabolism [Ammoniphilus resinae]
MLAEERRAKIIEFLKTEETMTVQHLSEKLKVSEMTIRRDLITLDKKRVIRRIHGGATILQREKITVRSPFNEREDRLWHEKLRIAKKTAETIKDGETILMDIGTTTHLVAQHLKHRTNLFIVTNSIKIAHEMAGLPSIKVLLLGGYLYDPFELSLVGLPVIKMLSELRVDKAIIGVAGVHEDRGIVNLDLDESEIRKIMIHCAREVIVVADHSKIGKDSLVSVAPLTAIDTLITNKAADPHYISLFKQYGVQVILA